MGSVEGQSVIWHCDKASFEKSASEITMSSIMRLNKEDMVSENSEVCRMEKK